MTCTYICLIICHLGQKKLPKKSAKNIARDIAPCASIWVPCHNSVGAKANTTGCVQLS